MRLGILDSCLLRRGGTARATLYESVQLAQQAEALGFSRYWLAEHHERTAAHHAPDMLAALIAGSTESIRVGVAGILLKLHSPMRVAKTFRLMETFFPERIDLGVGAGGAEPAVIEAMRGGAHSLQEVNGDYPRRVAEPLQLLRGESPLVFNPPHVPAVWLLGAAQPFSARMAAHHGTSFGYPLVHTTSRDDPSILDLYRAEFRPRPEQSAVTPPPSSETPASAGSSSRRAPTVTAPRSSSSWTRPPMPRRASSATRCCRKCWASARDRPGHLRRHPRG